MRILFLFRCVGSAYVFYSADGVSGWSQMSKLVASDGAVGDYFGRSVSVCNNVIVVCAYAAATAAGSQAGERLIWILS